MIHTARYPSPIGELLLAEKDGFLTGLWMEGQKNYPTARESWVEAADSPVLIQTARWLDRYFAGENPSIALFPLAPEGSDFRKAVWKLLCDIPYGEVTTYGRLARQLAVAGGLRSLSAQAVGGAVGHNPISIIIPCHRVVGANGSLTGYAGGLERKKALLALEGVELSRMAVRARGTAH